MTAARQSPEPSAGRYRPLSWRRRLLIMLLAIATATTIVLTLVGKPGGASHPLPRSAPAAPPVCADGRGSGCVGGMATVIVPAPPAIATASAPR